MHLAALAVALSNGLRVQDREQSQVQRRALLAAEAGDQDRRPPRWTGTPAVTPGEQGRRLVDAPMSRRWAGTRQQAARTGPRARTGQRGPRGWTAQSAGRMEWRAGVGGAHRSCPARGCAPHLVVYRERPAHADSFRQAVFAARQLGPTRASRQSALAAPADTAWGVHVLKSIYHGYTDVQ